MYCKYEEVQLDAHQNKNLNLHCKSDKVILLNYLKK